MTKGGIPALAAVARKREGGSLAAVARKCEGGSPPPFIKQQITKGGFEPVTPKGGTRNKANLPPWPP
jgi:hypothetical protein